MPGTTKNPVEQSEDDDGIGDMFNADDEVEEEGLTEEGEIGASPRSRLFEKPDENPEKQDDRNIRDGKDVQDDDIVVKIGRSKRRRRVPSSEPRTISNDREGLKELDELVEDLDPGSISKVFMTLTRIEPKIFNHKNIAGYVTRYDKKIDIQEIKDIHGGGIYDIRFFGPKIDKNGRQNGTKIVSARRINISGDPIIEDEEERKRASENRDPDIVSKTLGAQEKMLMMEKEKTNQVDKRNQDLIGMLLTKESGDSKIIPVIQQMMEVTQKNSNVQLESLKEENRRARDESLRREEKHRDEINHLRDSFEKKSDNMMSPMVQLMLEKSKEDAARMQIMMTQMATIFSVQLDNQKVTSEAQMKMIMESSKLQTELLLGEVRRQSDELKDARISGKSDLVSEMRKLSTLKELVSSFGPGEPEKPSLTDKISENLPQIVEALPDVFRSIGSLFSKGTPVVIPTQRQLEAPRMEAPRMEAPRMEAPRTQQRPQPQPQPQNQEDELSVSIATLKVSAEEAIENDEDPAVFVDRAVVGKFPNDVLKKIALVPYSAIIPVLQQQLDGIDEEGQLFTVKGKNFLKKMHEALKVKLGM